MKRKLHSIFGYFLILFAAASLLSSCQKIAGHGTIPGSQTTSTGGTGGLGGATFGTATGTITFIIANGPTNTWTQPTYFVGLGTTPTTGSLVFSTTPSTLVTSGPNDLNLFLTTGFSVSFPGTTPGTYPMNFAGSFVKMPGLTLDAAGGSEKVTVSAESINVTSTSLGTVKGSVKGSFDGKMINLATYDSVRVSGTFNVQLQ
jgi:hypothetical protein